MKLFDQNINLKKKYQKYKYALKDKKQKRKKYKNAQTIPRLKAGLG